MSKADITYWSQSGDKSFAELACTLVKVEDIAFGIGMACESRLQAGGLTMEETGMLSLLNLGIRKILDELLYRVKKLEYGETDDKKGDSK